MKPFILIEVANNTVDDTTVVGDNQVIPIVVDWDTLDGDGESACDLMNEILGCYSPGEVPEGTAKDVITHLQDIMDEDDDFNGDDDELDEDEEEDEDDDYLDDEDEEEDEDDEDEEFDEVDDDEDQVEAPLPGPRRDDAAFPNG